MPSLHENYTSERIKATEEDSAILSQMVWIVNTLSGAAPCPEV